MREIPLTQAQVALIDDDDYGLVSGHTWYAHWDSKAKTFYAVTHVRGDTRSRSTLLRMHTLIMGKKGVDHRDHNGLNNQRSNLRVATSAQNNANQRRRSDNSTGYKGVSLDRGRYRAYINLDGQFIHLGTYDDSRQAARAYDKAARELFGEFAYPNFPESSIDWDSIEPIFIG